MSLFCAANSFTFNDGDPHGLSVLESVNVLLIDPPIIFVTSTVRENGSRDSSSPSIDVPPP